jgi:hypothetical protein
VQAVQERALADSSLLATSLNGLFGGVAAVFFVEKSE